MGGNFTSLVRGNVKKKCHRWEGNAWAFRSRRYQRLGGCASRAGRQVDWMRWSPAGPDGLDGDHAACLALWASAGVGSGKLPEHLLP